MAKYHLHRWSVSMDDDPYQAPEVRAIRLVGFRDDETKQVITSPIKEVNGREATTWSGSIYILEDMDTGYRDWLIENNKDIDWGNPFKSKK
jgi:hypothetical protein